MKFTPSDRVMIAAPHPDDETLANGGLIQQLAKTGATGRVLMVTNGDNNPWPQRWLEKRWHIGPEERQRWGAMRRGEALAALQRLGFTGQTQFLGYPDQSLSGSLLKNDPSAMEGLCAALREAFPTFLVLPSTGDLHPDHNALHVLLQIALARTGLGGIPQLHYAVHCHHRELIPNPVHLQLTEPERLRKREAIACHKSQMVLSSKRFLAYARSVEEFYEPAPAQPLSRHVLSEARVEAGQLRVRGVKTRFSPKGWLWIVGETAKGESLRWQVAIPFSSGSLPIENCVNGATEGQAKVKIEGPVMSFQLPVPDCLSLLYLKYHRPAIFLDPSGWRQVPLAR